MRSSFLSLNFSHFYYQPLEWPITNDTFSWFIIYLYIVSFCRDSSHISAFPFCHSQYLIDMQLLIGLWGITEIIRNQLVTNPNTAPFYSIQENINSLIRQARDLVPIDFLLVPLHLWSVVTVRYLFYTLPSRMILSVWKPIKYVRIAMIIHLLSNTTYSIHAYCSCQVKKRAGLDSFFLIAPNYATPCPRKTECLVY